VAIHPEGVEVSANKIFGGEDAEFHAHRMIDKLLDAKSGQRKDKQSDKPS
jgi:hypothetical protein